MSLKRCSEGSKHVGFRYTAPVYGWYMQETKGKDKRRGWGYIPCQRNGSEEGRSLYDLKSHLQRTRYQLLCSYGREHRKRGHYIELFHHLHDPIHYGFTFAVTNTAVTIIQIAVEKFSEATVGYRESREIADTWVQLFSTPYFMVTPVRNSHASSNVI